MTADQAYQLAVKIQVFADLSNPHYKDYWALAEWVITNYMNACDRAFDALEDAE